LRLDRKRHLQEVAGPFAVTDFISTYFFVMGLNEMLVFPDWNPRATLALQLAKLASNSIKVR
jgi:hypothetical protein